MAIAYHVHDFLIPTATNEEASNGTVSDKALVPSNLPPILSTKQDLSTALTSIAGLSTSANQTIYTTAENAYATTALTSLGRDIIGSETAAAIRAFLDLEPGVDVQAYSANLDTLAAVTPGAVGLAILQDATAADVRAELDLEPGTDVQAQSATLQELADLTPGADGTVLGRVGGAFEYVTTGTGDVVAANNLSDLDDTEAATGNLDFLQSGTGATARSVRARLRDALSVLDFAATGDGVTDDGTAIANAITEAVASGRDLFWPAGDYLTTASIPNFHDVKHYGPGRIVRDGVTYRFRPTGSQLSTIYVGSSGDDANDGLSSNDPVATIQRALDILSRIGDAASDGRWRIQLLSGIHTEPAFAGDLPFFTNYLEIRGTNEPVLAWAEGQTVQVGDYRTTGGGTILLRAESEGVTGPNAVTQTYGTRSDGGVTWRYIGGHRAWAAGAASVPGTYRRNGNNLYRATTTSTNGSTPPTHTSGVVSDGGTSWAYVGAYCAPPTSIPTSIIDGFKTAPLWATSQVVKAGASRYFGTNVYIAANAGTTGATAPTHTSGSVSDGAVVWRYRGQRDASLGNNGIWIQPGCRVNLNSVRFRNWEKTAFGDYAFLMKDQGVLLGQGCIFENCTIGAGVINGITAIWQNSIWTACYIGPWGTYNSNLSVGTNLNTSCFISDCDQGSYVSRSSVAHIDFSHIEDCRNGVSLSILSRVHCLSDHFKRCVKPLWAIGGSEWVDNPDSPNAYYYGQVNEQNTEPPRQDGFSRIDNVHNEECQAEIRYTAFVGSSIYTAAGGDAGTNVIVNNAAKALPKNWFLHPSKKVRVVVRGKWVGTAGTKAIFAALGANSIATASRLAAEAGDFVYQAEIIPLAANSQIAGYEYRRHTNTIAMSHNAARTVPIIDANGIELTQGLRIYANLAGVGDSLELYSVEWFITG